MRIASVHMDNPLNSYLITISIFLLTNIGITIWRLAVITTTLNIVKENLKEIADEIKTSRGVYITKEEMVAYKAIIDKEIKAMWLIIDKLNKAV